MIPEGGQAQPGLPLLLFLLFLRRFGPGDGVVVAPVFRVVLQHAQPLEHPPVGAVPDLGPVSYTHLVQLMVMKCDKFKGKGFDAFLMSQMWDCREDRERIFKECQYQVAATDMLAAALPALERADLDAGFVEALAELYPTCEAFYFQNCGKLLLAEDVRSHQIQGPDRFIRFGVNVRFFNIQGLSLIHIWSAAL